MYLESGALDHSAILTDEDVAKITEVLLARRIRNRSAEGSRLRARCPGERVKRRSGAGDPAKRRPYPLAP